MASEARIHYLDGERIVTKAPPWHLAVSFDLFLSSVSSGTFTVAAILLLISPFRWAVLSIIGFWIAFAVELFDLVSLVADLGDPLRFHHMLRQMKFRSPMSLGVWLSSGLAFFAFLAVAISFFLARGFFNLLPLLKIVAILGLPFALGVAGYKGVLLSATAQPVWGKMRWLGTVIAISAGSCGVTMMLAIASARGDLTGALTLRFGAGVVLAVYTVALALAMRPINHALAHVTGRLEIILWNVVAVGLGGAIPAVLAFLQLELFAEYFRAIAFAILACTLAGAFAFKHVLVTIPHRLAPES